MVPGIKSINMNYHDGYVYAKVDSKTGKLVAAEFSAAADIQASLKRERIRLKRASVSLRRKPVALPTSIMILASFTRHPDIAAKLFISMPQRA